MKMTERMSGESISRRMKSHAVQSFYSRTSFARTVQNESGFSLIQIMVSTGIVGIIVLAMTTMMTFMSQQQKNTALLFNVDQVRRELVTLLSNTAHWQSTIQNNTSLDCLNSTVSPKPDCTNAAVLNFKIFTAGGQPYFDPSSQGFTSDGRVCAQADQNCILRLALTLEALCAATGSPPVPEATCAAPVDVQVKGLFSLHGQQFANTAFNPANYTVSLRKDPAGGPPGGGGGIIVYKSDGTTPLGKFVSLETPSETCIGVTYLRPDGTLNMLSAADCHAVGSTVFTQPNCTGTMYVDLVQIYNIPSLTQAYAWGCTGLATCKANPVTKNSSVSPATNVYIYSRRGPDGVCQNYGGFPPQLPTAAHPAVFDPGTSLCGSGRCVLR